MFTFGTYTASPPSVVAVLDQWTTLPGLSVDTVERAGDGQFYAGGKLDPTQLSFNVRLQADTPGAVLTLADKLGGACHPSHGLQTLRINVLPGWAWGAAVAAEIPWTRGAWHPGARCQLLGKLVFTCPDPYAYADPDETWLRTGPGALHATRRLGNTPSRPTLELRGNLSPSHTITLNIAGTPLTVTGPLPPSQVLRLDYRSMDFGRWQGTTKIASALPQMSTYTRPALPVGPFTITAATTGVLTELRVNANSRRA